MKILEKIDDYVPNNIEFRVFSSRSLSEYKNTQNFVLAEMAYGRYKFSKTAREIAVLYGDAMFKGLLLVESLLVRSGSSTVSEKTKDEVVAILTARIAYMHTLIQTRKDIFDPQFVAPCIDMHEYVDGLVRKRAKEAAKLGTREFFREVVLCQSDMFDALRLELQEVDALITKDALTFLNISDFCSREEYYNDRPLIIHQLKVLAKYSKKPLVLELRDYTTSIRIFNSVVEDIEAYESEFDATIVRRKQ